MARSLRNGDYRLLLAVQSPRDPERWYRVLADNATGVLSCDCPAWTFNQRGDRAFKHTEFVAALVRGQRRAASVPRMRIDHPLIGATRTQWAPLRQFVAEDAWGLQEGRGLVGGEAFDLVLVEATGASGSVASGSVAFARVHKWPIGQRAAAVAGWCGYAIAADFARQAGAAFIGEPPAHWRGEAPARRRGASPPASGEAAILQVGNRPDLGDGLTPAERAERTLRLFLGAERLALLQRQGFLDIASALHTGRVYRNPAVIAVRRGSSRSHAVLRVAPHENGAGRASWLMLAKASRSRCSPCSAAASLSSAIAARTVSVRCVDARSTMLRERQRRHCHLCQAARQRPERAIPVTARSGVPCGIVKMT